MKGVIGFLLRRRETAAFLALVLLFVVLSAVRPKSFPTAENLGIVARQFSMIATMGVGMTMAIVLAGIDLSVGSVLALSGCVTALSMTKGINIPLAVLFGLLCGAFCGFINGIAIVGVRMPPFIATLGMMSIARGLTYVITGGWPITGLPEKFFFLGQGMIGAVPMPVVIMFFCLIIGHIIMSNTVLGRAIYAIGGNEQAAFLSGINVNRVKIIVYTLAGLLSGLAGVVMTSRLSSAQPNSGLGIELDVIAAVIIGGASFAGGEGTIIGTFIGAAFMGILRNGLVLLNVSAYWQQVVIGAVIMGAIAIDFLRTSRMQR
ncbi:ABC transporter permease [bacterium]|nr:ABC transporter permease [bacterium]